MNFVVTNFLFKELINKLPLHYSNNYSAWMTAEFFIDNCKTHPHVYFANVIVYFLPSNTTSVLQPMDTWVNKCFKIYYRVKLSRHIISYLEADGFNQVCKPTMINLYQALEMCCSSWGHVHEKCRSEAEENLVDTNELKQLERELN